MMKKLEEIRNQINSHDYILYKTLEERFKLCQKISYYKDIYNIKNTVREKEIIETIQTHSTLDKEFVEKLMNLIFEESKKIQINEMLKKQKI